MPPLSANSLLFILSIFILASAFRDYSTIKDIPATRLLLGRKYQIID